MGATLELFKHSVLPELKSLIALLGDNPTPQRLWHLKAAGIIRGFQITDETTKVAPFFTTDYLVKERGKPWMWNNIRFNNDEEEVK